MKRLAWVVALCGLFALTSIACDSKGERKAYLELLDELSHQSVFCGFPGFETCEDFYKALREFSKTRRPQGVESEHQAALAAYYQVYLSETLLAEMKMREAQRIRHVDVTTLLIVNWPCEA